MSTPTPRTDAASALTSQHRHDDLFGDPEFGWVTAGFARTLERELAALTAERDQLRAALALGQQNCDDAYDDLRDERDAANARAERAEAEVERLTKSMRVDTPAMLALNEEILKANGEAIARAERAEAEVERLKTCGIAELAAVNSSVLEYCKHWESRAERAEAEIIRLRTENSDLKATDTRPLLTGKLTHAGLCRIDGELVDGVFIAVYREQIKACPRLPMYQEIELRIVAYK